MRKPRNAYILYVAIAFTLLSASCQYRNEEEMAGSAENANVIALHWPRAYATENPLQVETGLLWTLSFLGADLAPEQKNDLLRWNEDVLWLDFSKAGLNPRALVKVKQLCDVLKNSDEYRAFGSIDIGRFISLSIGSSWHYYAITGASPLSTVLANVSFDTLQGAILRSCVADGHRIIRMPKGNSFAFLAMEGSGRIGHNFQVQEYELLDVMPNGQLRAALYNLDGELKPAADSGLSRAGKVAKCLWCHEITLNPNFDTTESAPGYLRASQFNAIVDQKMGLLGQQRQQLNSLIDFNQKQDHTQMELLYISFMEPSADRLAKEWRLPLAAVQQRLAGLSVHTHQEFPFLGNLYHRAETDSRAPYKTIKVPESIREKSFYEPDFLK